MATFGYTTVGDNSSAIYTDKKQAARFQCPENGQATSITWYGRGAGYVRFGIYSDNNGAPDALLGYTGEILLSSTNKWWTANLTSPVNLTAGAFYWLAVLFGQVSYYYYDTGETNQGAYVSDTYSDGFSDPFGTPSYSNRKMSIYCTYTPSGAGQLYEIYLDAVSQSLAAPSYETTYNIAKDASVTSQSLHAPETTFNIPKDAITQALADVIVEKVVGAVIEIFQDAVATSQATFTLESAFNLNPEATATTQATVNLETIFNLVKDAIIHATATSQIVGIYPINKDALVDASATPNLQQTLGINKDAITVAVSTPLIQSTFNISPEATVKVLAEVTVIKPTEIKVTKLFLIIGDLAIQIQGN